MNKFQTIGEVRTEKARLNAKKEILEDEIRQDYEELKESLRPINLIKDLFTSDKHEQNGQSISPISPIALNLGSTVLDLLFSKLVFKNSSIVKKLLSSYVIHATGPSMIQKFAPTIVSTFKTLLNTFTQKKKPMPYYEQSTAGNWHEE